MDNGEVVFFPVVELVLHKVTYVTGCYTVQMTVWRVTMGIVSGHGLLIACLLMALVMYSGHSFAADIDEKIGGRVDLKGTAVSADAVYLFVTGPGLPSNGVRLDTMQVPVVNGDPGSFTVTDVSNDRWAYSWNTARQGFSLKEGIYNVYAAKKPVGKSGVNNAVYGTISVSLTNSGRPYTSSGTVVFNTTPVISEIFIDGQSVGNTPQTRGLPEGDHEIRFERPGYRMVTEQVSITPGSFESVQRTLIPETTQVVTSFVTQGLLTPVPTSAPATPTSPAATKKAPVAVPVIVISVSVALLTMGLKKKAYQ